MVTNSKCLMIFTLSINSLSEAFPTAVVILLYIHVDCSLYLTQIRKPFALRWSGVLVGDKIAEWNSTSCAFKLPFVGSSAWEYTLAILAKMKNAQHQYLIFNRERQNHNKMHTHQKGYKGYTQKPYASPWCVMELSCTEKEKTVKPFGKLL